MNNKKFWAVSISAALIISNMFVARADMADMPDADPVAEELSYTEGFSGAEESTDMEEFCGFEEYGGYVEAEEGESTAGVRRIPLTELPEEDQWPEGMEPAVGAVPDRSGDGAELPERFMTRNLPPLRNQQIGGPCWSFGMNACAEIYALCHEGMYDDCEILGYVDEDGNYTESDDPPEDAEHVIYDIDLSEAQTCYFMYNTPTDPFGGTAGDKNGFKDSSYNCFSFGGNFLYARNMLMGWVGPAAEEDAKYSDRSTIISDGLDESLAYKDVYHVTNNYMVNFIDNPELVKSFIMKNGAVAASIYLSSSYYDTSENSYWCYNKYSTNHAVTLVGWDDSFPAESFKPHSSGDVSEYPTVSGAWIVRNSHYTSGPYGMSRQGYFYISYEDTSLIYDKSAGSHKACYAFDYELSDNYYGCYQYDGGMVSGKLSKSNSVAGANVFTAKAGDAGEYIKSVSFGTESTEQDYDIYIFTGIPEDATDPRDGFTAFGGCLQSGSVRLAGYHTVKLDTPVYVQPGDRFSVMVRLRKSADALDPSEKPSLSYESNSPKSWNSFKSECSINRGESYYISGTATDLADQLADNDGLYDGGRKGGNFRIKAYTDPASQGKELHYQSLQTDLGSTVLELTEGDGYDLTVHTYPYENTTDSLHFLSSAPEVVSVNKAGHLTAVGEGSARISIYADSRFTVLTAVNVKVSAAQKDSSSSSAADTEEKESSSSSSSADTEEKESSSSSSSADTEEKKSSSSSSSADTEEKKSSSSSSSADTEEKKSSSSSSASVPISVSQNIVVKQQMSLAPFISGIYKKYVVTPKGYAKVNRKNKILKAKKPGLITVTGYTKVNGVWEMGESAQFIIRKPAVVQKVISASDPGTVIEGIDNINDRSLMPDSWSSSKPEVAAVDEKTGRIILGETPGKTVITLYYGTGKGAARIKFKVKNI